MSGFSIDDRVTLTGFPKQREWMAGMVGEVGVVAEVKTEGIRAVRLSGLMSEPFWIAERHVEAAPSEDDKEVGAA